MDVDLLVVVDGLAKSTGQQFRLSKVPQTAVEVTQTLASPRTGTGS